MTHPQDSADASRNSTSTASGRICGLFLYPIKGCRGVAVDRVDIEPGGPKGDRRFMIVSDSGMFLSQRTHPKLAQVDCRFARGGGLTLGAPGAPSFDCPFPNAESQRSVCRIWKDDVVVSVSQGGSDWFTGLLGERVRLVHIDAPDLRQVDPKRARPGDLVGLADAYPLLWTNTASLSDLNRHTQTPIPMDRFRPNVVTEGLPAYREDTARDVQLGAGHFFVPKLCDRCVVTTTDQQTGERGREPLRALSRSRRWNQAVWFGANLVPNQEQAGDGFSVRLGDPVRIVADRPHPRNSGGA